MKQTIRIAAAFTVTAILGFAAGTAGHAASAPVDAWCVKGVQSVNGPCEYVAGS
ncbi:hypothetical protein [Terrabacter sp. 2YAF2]|uniref:hypothetical protein n=1 Tax=Terrabacter sp. 2YAF2 TaxID=3233026 RepID=UPI003F94BAF7